MLRLAAWSSSARRSGSSSTASRVVEGERLQRGPRRRAVEERAVLQPEQQPDAARGRLRPELAAGRGFLVDELEDLAEQLGAGVALRETERDRPAGAPIDLGHPVHLGARALVVRRPVVRSAARPRTRPCRARPSTSAIASSSRSSAHVPGTGRPSGTRCSSVRDVEKPSAPALHRLVDEVGHRPRCRRRSRALRRGRVRPSRSGAARSARPCRRR